MHLEFPRSPSLWLIVGILPQSGSRGEALHLRLDNFSEDSGLQPDLCQDILVYFFNPQNYMSEICLNSGKPYSVY